MLKRHRALWAGLLAAVVLLHGALVAQWSQAVVPPAEAPALGAAGTPVAVVALPWSVPDAAQPAAPSAVLTEPVEAAATPAAAPPKNTRADAPKALERLSATSTAAPSSVVRDPLPARGSATSQPAEAHAEAATTPTAASIEAPGTADSTEAPASPMPPADALPPAGVLLAAADPVPSSAPSRSNTLTARAADASAPGSAATAVATANDAGSPAPALPTYRTRIPTATVVNYRLSRSGIVGSGELEWKPEAGGYTARLEGRVPLLGTLITQISRGRFDAAGLAPERYTDKRLRRGELAASFQRSGGIISFSGQQPDVPISPGVQDRVSVMVQLAAIAAGWSRTPPVGEHFLIRVVGARGDAQVWSLRFEGPQTLTTPEGPVAALHFLREPKEPTDTRAEFWLDPARQFLPIRVRIADGSGDALELMRQP